MKRFIRVYSLGSGSVRHPDFNCFAESYSHYFVTDGGIQPTAEEFVEISGFEDQTRILTPDRSLADDDFLPIFAQTRAKFCDFEEKTYC